MSEIPDKPCGCGCGRPVEQPTTGRPALWFSDACRKRAARAALTEGALAYPGACPHTAHSKVLERVDDGLRCRRCGKVGQPHRLDGTPLIDAGTPEVRLAVPGVALRPAVPRAPRVNGVGTPALVLGEEYASRIVWGDGKTPGR
jgi:hypothetical protein